MSDRDASISDAAFREALDAFGDAYANDIEFAMRRTRDRLDAARARVLALYAERQGEEQVKTVMYGEAYVLRPRKDGAIILWPDGDYRVLRELKPGDRVRVVRCEVGMYDPKNDPPTGGAK